MQFTPEYAVSFITYYKLSTFLQRNDIYLVQIIFKALPNSLLSIFFQKGVILKSILLVKKSTKNLFTFIKLIQNLKIKGNRQFIYKQQKSLFSIVGKIVSGSFKIFIV